MGSWGRLESYVIVTSLAGAGVLVWATPRVGLWQAVVAMTCVAAAELFATHFRDDVSVSLTNVVVFVAVLTVSPALAVVATLGALPVLAFQVKQQRLLRVAFNTGQLALTAGAAGALYAAIASLGLDPFPSVISLVALAVASTVFSVVNHALVAVPVALMSSERFLSAFSSVWTSIALQVPYVAIALLAAVTLVYASPWALLLMAVPVAIARHGLLAFQRLDESYDRLVRSFVKAIEIKDLYTRGHSERVAELSVHVAEELGVPYDERRLTRYAALLHDVGKIGVPLCIINKPGPLDDEEFEAIKQHPSIGADILHDIDFLAPAIDIVRYHHERIDGRGYPHGVSGDELSDIVRIVTAVDAFDAMTSTRSYRRALEVEDALAELRRCAGTQFDPRMVEALARAVERIGWQPTVEFASEQHLHGEEIPVGTAEERFGHDVPEAAK
jgi:putative nucleotidyltransferase with HDIG domain